MGKSMTIAERAVAFIKFNEIDPQDFKKDFKSFARLSRLARPRTSSRQATAKLPRCLSSS